MGNPSEIDLGGVTLVAKNYKLANTTGATSVASNVIKHTTGATLSLTAAQSGATVFLAKADGVVITLPASAVGLTYNFVVFTSVTSNAYKLSTATQGTEFFDGTYVSLDSDGTGVVGVIFTGDGSTHDNYSMNGTTTGGLVGTELSVTCTAANKWTVGGFNRGSGTVVTSFATT